MKRQHIIISVIIAFTLLAPLAYQTMYLQADEADYYSKIFKKSMIGSSRITLKKLIRMSL